MPFIDNPFISNPANDLVLKRGERFARIGSAIPWLAVAVLNIVAATVYAAMNRRLPWEAIVAAIVTLAGLGQVMVWAGMECLRRSAGWDSGIVFFLWMGGFFTSGTFVYIGILPLAVIPWIAPIIATIAKLRLVQRKRVKEGAAA